MIEYLTEQEVLNMDTNYIIETKNLTKQYGSQKSVADLNIHVQKGRIYGLLGRNGAGKTTTMKMLLGLTKPTSGEVKIWGKSLQGNEKKLLPRIGSLIESPGFYPNLTGTENLRIFATLRGVPNNHAIKDALDLVGLPYKDKKLFSQYSLGMKQRLAIALAVMHDPEKYDSKSFIGQDLPERILLAIISPALFPCPLSPTCRVPTENPARLRPAPGTFVSVLRVPSLPACSGYRNGGTPAQRV